MPLQFKRYRGHDFDRRVCKFSMMNGEKEVRFVASWELMDDLERTSDTRADQRDEQFERLQGPLIAIAERKFFSMLDAERPADIALLTEDRQRIL